MKGFVSFREWWRRAAQQNSKDFPSASGFAELTGQTADL